MEGYVDSYNDMKEKALIKYINSLDRVVRRKEIQMKADLLLIPSRTLSDMLKRSVEGRQIKRLSQGLYTSVDFKLPSF
tara:strand:- start:306 stop:539 length:234 start_codon:yes stop_codon:yes gene_type:complete